MAPEYRQSVRRVPRNFQAPLFEVLTNVAKKRVEHHKIFPKPGVLDAVKDIPRATPEDIFRSGGRNLAVNIVFAKQQAHRRRKEVTCGAKGGKSSSKACPAIEKAIKKLVANHPEANGKELWNLIPESQTPLVVELDENDCDVYRDGDKLIAADIHTSHTWEIKKGTFINKVSQLKKTRK